jgi:hypothetical protein
MSTTAAVKTMEKPKLWVSGDLNGFFGLCTNLSLIHI